MVIFAGIACSTDQFECVSDRKCIPKSWTCDGENDCGDSSDEQQDCQGRKILWCFILVNYFLN